MIKNSDAARRDFLKNIGLLATAMMLPTGQLAFGKNKKQGMKLGFVTYLQKKLNIDYVYANTLEIENGRLILAILRLLKL